MPIYEPGLEELVRRNRAGRPADVHDRPADAPSARPQIVFIAVGTPQGEDGSADLQHVLGVARDVARAMNGYKVIVDKSTVPVGTAREGARGDPPRDDASVQRRQQPRVPEAGRGDRGLPEARPRGHRRRRSARRRGDARALRAVHAHRRADHGDGLRQRRAVQVRRERDAGDAHLVHERGRATSASWSAPTSTRCARAIGVGQAHRRRRSCSRASATAAAASRRT